MATHAPRQNEKSPPKTARKKAPPPTEFPVAYKQEGDTVKTAARFVHGGVGILIWTAEFPCFATHGSPKTEKKGDKRIRDFYITSAHAAENYIHHTLLPRLIEQYEADPDPRKRFRHTPPRLSLLHTVTHADGQFLSVCRTVTLSRGGRILLRRQSADVFSKKTGRLCPPAYLRRAGFPMAEPVPVSPDTPKTAGPAATHIPPKNKRKKAAHGSHYIGDGRICFLPVESS